MTEITSVWISPDRSYLVVQVDGEDGQLVGIDMTVTHPDGITPECHDHDVVDATFGELGYQDAREGGWNPVEVGP